MDTGVAINLDSGVTLHIQRAEAVTLTLFASERHVVTATLTAAAFQRLLKPKGCTLDHGPLQIVGMHRDILFFVGGRKVGSVAKAQVLAALV